jgi:ABC-2 type transport system ATP-binding protein
VLDEPTNGLDPVQILDVRELIRDIATTRAVMISTHILPEVQAMCDNIMMIERGRVVFSGTIREFGGYLAPSAILAIMHNAPSDEEFMAIEGMERVERLTRTRVRLHFDGDGSIFGRIVARSVAAGWELREISLEKESLDKVFAKLSGKQLR